MRDLLLHRSRTQLVSEESSKLVFSTNDIKWVHADEVQFECQRVNTGFTGFEVGGVLSVLIVR